MPPPYTDIFGINTTVRRPWTAPRPSQLLLAENYFHSKQLLDLTDTEIAQTLAHALTSPNNVILIKAYNTTQHWLHAIYQRRNKNEMSAVIKTFMQSGGFAATASHIRSNNPSLHSAALNLAALISQFEFYLKKLPRNWTTELDSALNNYEAKNPHWNSKQIFISMARRTPPKKPKDGIRRASKRKSLP
jgi:hypothetical protein